MQRAHGEVRVDLGGGATGTVGASQQVGVEDVLEMAERIWEETNASGVNRDDDAGNDALLKSLQIKHQDFATSYPIPFRWMVQAREYDAKAFKSWLTTQVKVMYPSRKEFLEAQGEYLVILYKVRNPRASAKAVAAYREQIIKSLKKDDEAFMRAREEADEEVKKLDKANDDDRRRQLVAYLTKLQKAREISAGKDQ